MPSPGPTGVPEPSVTLKHTPARGSRSVPLMYFRMAKVILGSFSKSRLLSPPVPLPPGLVPVPPLVTVLAPLFSTMVWGVVLRTWVSGTLYSVTTTVEPGRRPLTVTVPSFPVVYRPISSPLAYFTVKVVLGMGLPVTESTLESVKWHRGVLYT